MTVAIHNGAVPVHAPVQKEQGVFDRIAQFAEMDSGAWNIVKAVDHVCQYALQWTGLSMKGRDRIADIRSKIAGPSALFWFPLFVRNCVDFRNKVYSVIEARKLPVDSAERQKKMNHALKGAVIDGNNVVNVGTQVVMLVYLAKAISLTNSTLFALDVVFNVTNVVGDGSSLLDQPEKFREFRNLAENGKTDAEKAYYRSKEYQTFNKLVKYTASVGLSAIVLVSYLFGVSMSAVAWLPPLLLGFAITYLVTDIASIFFQNINEDKRKALGIAPH